MKFITLLILFFSSQVFAGKCFISSRSQSCPNTKTVLGNEHEAQGLFVGVDFDYHVDNLNFLESLFEIAKSRKDFPPINILLPKSYRYFKGKSLKEIRSLKKTMNVKTGELYYSLYELVKKYEAVARLIKTEEQTTLWTQDLFELNLTSGRGELHNFRKKYGQDYKTTFKNQCAVDLTESSLPVLQVNVEERQFEDGGNLESALGVPLIGSSFPDSLKKYYKKEYPDTIEVDVSWLEVGHVDEVIQLIPSKSKCGVSLIYPSPKFGLSFLPKTEKKGTCSFNRKFSKSAILKYFPGCYDSLKENKELQVKIEREVNKIAKSIEKRTSCKKIDLVPVPALFFRDFTKKSKEKGLAPNRYRNLFPSLVNSVVVGKALLMAKQPIKKVEDYMKRKAKTLGLVPYFLPMNYLHDNDGSVHCAINVARGCK